MTRPAVVVMVRNAFRPERDRQVLAVKHPVTIRGWLDGQGIAEFPQPTICLVNGRAVLRGDWSLLVIRSGDVVCFLALPHGGGGGGGGGGKNPLRTVLTVAVMVAGMAAGAAFGGALAGAFGFEAGGAAFGSVTWGQIFGGVISGAVNLAGGALINALVPAPSPSRPSADWGLGSIGSPPSPRPTYSLQAQGNQARLGQPIPVIYGRHLVYPDLAAEPWYEYQDNEQYLHQLHVIGQGFHDFEALRIEDTDIGNFAEVQYQIIEPGAAVTLFDPSVTTAPEVSGQELTAPNELGSGETGWIGPFVSASAETTASHIGIDIVFARGLYYANDSGGLDSRTISWVVEARLIDDEGLALGGWIQLASESKSAASNTPIRLSYKYAVSPGRYEVRMKRTDNKDTSSRAGHEIRWAGLRAWLQDEPDYGQVTLLAIRMRATDNLSGRTSRMVNCIVTRKLPVWSQGGWSAPLPTRSIAWAFADAARAGYGGELADARIDLACLLALDALWEQRGDHFDGVFDTSMTVWEALTRLARCGRAVPIQQGGIVRIVRDGPQSLPVALFGPRNIAKGSFRIRYVMPGQETADAVTVEYFSARTWRPDEVTAKLADSAEEKPARLQLMGCIGKDHALREGLYMAAANRYRRKLITFQTELEGLIPTYGDLVAVVHDMPQWGQGGEIVGWDGEVLVVSEPLEWTESESHYIALRRSDGSIAGPYQVLPGEDEYEAVPQAPLGFTPYVGGEAERTHYAFGPGDAWSLQARVLAIRPRGERVEIACVGEHDAVHVN
ncbi:MAG: phage tail protein [Alphaproteobacteria bacterium]|nr:phage tail protein [Alphaproteobacteria bacterium]